jgi:outer membrane cobalamin receptor
MTKHLFKLLLLTAAVQAQENGIQGTVVDPSGRAVRGATVACDGDSQNIGLDGSFRFEARQICDATIRAPGFESVRMDLTAGPHHRVELKVAGVVETVVITATRTQTTLEQAGVSGNVVTAPELATRDYPFLPDLLRELPGMHIARTGREGSLATLYTRGGQRTSTLVLLDGVPLNDPGGELNLGHLATSELARIEVIRGPESALFGAEAASGAIQLFTRRGDPEQVWPRGSLSYERGSFKTDRWIAGLYGGSGARLDYALNAQQFHTAGEFPNDFYRNTSGAANVGYALSNATRVRGIVRSYDAILGVPGQVRYGLVDRDAFQSTRDTATAFRVDDARGPRFIHHAMFGYHRTHDVFTDLLMQGPYPLNLLVRDVATPVRRVYREAILDRAPDQLPPGTRLVSFPVTLFPSEEPFVTSLSRTHAEYQGTLGHTGGSLAFGYEFERQEGEITSRDVHRNNHGVFLVEQFSVNRRLHLAGGLRAEHSSVFGTKWAPRASASLLIGGLSFLRFSAGRGITEPTLVYNFARSPFFTGNPELRPEKTTAYEAGLVSDWLGRRIRTEIAAFHNSFEDLIVFVSAVFPGTWQNIDRSYARGLEFSARARVGRALTINAAYTFLHTRVVHSSAPTDPYQGIGQELGRRPRHSGSASLLISPTRWWFQTGAFVVGERQDTDFFGVTRNAGYAHVWASGGWHIHRFLAPFVRADNLLNSRYEETLGYSGLARSIRGGVRIAW